jgi:hypothetical protein
MNAKLARRRFLRTAALAGCGVATTFPLPAAPKGAGFSFVLLGDLHFDKPEHHDLDWLRANKPNDLRQVEDYCQITREVTPKLFQVVRESLTVLKQAGETPPGFVLQVGDLVEGLCGSEALATRQNSQALEFVRQAGFGLPFLFTKGNHDITGDGAPEAFQSVFHPFIAEQAKLVDRTAEISKACHAFRHGNSLFCCFDAYDKNSLPWLESILAKRTEQHCFVNIHPPVVPYGARSTWHVYSRPKQQAEREKLLELLAQQKAYVLGGHIHKYNTLVRKVPKHGAFLQLAISSIVRSPQVLAKNVLGATDYTEEQIKVEPRFSPETEQERRAIYTAEKSLVSHFQYADLPGYAVLTVNGPKVEARIFSGATRNLWKSINLSNLL